MCAPEFIKVATRYEIEPGQMKVINIDDVVVVIVNLDGEYYAFEAICPHRDGPLYQGYLWKNSIECPWHHFRYDIRTGENIYPKNVYPNIENLQRDLRPLHTYQVKVEGRDIKLRLPWPCRES